MNQPLALKLSPTLQYQKYVAT
ncbi:hypothetical protein BIW11_02805 [Tropilaelaps mercedesae]|uniref:Uncharacterized protein n=1 Tax=Tropilaelaps mercedesae TaxID=418985 RepID=A0A1V9XX49_9ACAR|nr:hypothetical protein BIW11_02805 [Tropilaelaps mercedesae]